MPLQHLSWYAQPQEVAPLRAELYAGLRSFNDPDTVQLVPQALTSRVEGRCILFNGARYWDSGFSPNTSEISLIVIAAQGSTTNALLVSSCAASGDDGIELLCGATAGQTSLRINTTGSALQTSTAATGLNDSRAHVYAASWRSGEGANFWVDGRLIATTSALSGTLNSTQNLMLARRGATYMTTAGGYGLLMAAWDSASVVESLGYRLRLPDVWDALYEPRRIFVPQAAASGLPTLSAATYVPGSLSSSGFRPRVTATY